MRLPLGMAAWGSIPAKTALRWSIVAIALIGGVVVWTLGPARRPDVADTGLAIVSVELRGDAERWMGDFTGDALTTVLSTASSVPVYSRELVAFHRQSQNIATSDVARSLGATRTLEAVLTGNQEHLILELRVLSLSTGRVVTVERVEGARDALVDLQNRAAASLLHDLGVPVDERKLQKLLVARSTTGLETYRLLTETLSDPEDLSEGNRSNRGEGPQWWSLAEAHAALDPASEEEIRALIDRYKAALESREPDEVAALCITFTAEQRKKHEKYFKNAEGLTVTFEDIGFTEEGERTLVTFQRTDSFTDKNSQRHIDAAFKGTFTATRGDGEEWKIYRLRGPQ